MLLVEGCPYKPERAERSRCEKEEGKGLSKVRCVDTIYASDHLCVLTRNFEFSSFSQLELTISLSF